MLDVQVHLRKLEYGEKFIFSSTFSKTETFKYFRFIACKVKHFKSFFVLFWWLELTANESQKSVSQNIYIWSFNK